MDPADREAFMQLQQKMQQNLITQEEFNFETIKLFSRQDNVVSQPFLPLI
jgi:hypothetical protein